MCLVRIYLWFQILLVVLFFFFNDTATTEIYTLSLHDALPISRLPEFIARRRALAEAYRRGLAGAACQFPPDASRSRHVYHRFVIQVELPLERLIPRLEQRGIQCRRPVFRPLHRALGAGGFPQADLLWERSLSIPCYPSLTDGQVEQVAAAV